MAVGDRNHFDVLRLLAAYQVVLAHAVDFLEVDLPPVVHGAYVVVRWFPGVPIFFAISGYLLTRALDRNPRLGTYALNRALRIFPGLWANVAGTLVLLAAAGLLFELGPARLVAFVAAHMTIGQFWTPSPVTEYGLGTPLTPNSALWTIRVEIGFYIGLPFLLLGGIWLLRSRRIVDAAIVVTAVVSFLFYGLVGDPIGSDEGMALWLRLITNSPLPHLFLFLAGVLSYRHRDDLIPLLRRRGLALLALFLVVRGGVWAIWETGDGLAPAAAIATANLLLVLPVLAFSFARSDVLGRLRPPIDISYGVYLWHMVVVNAIVHWDVAAGADAAGIVLVATTMLGVASWYLVEAPALSLKRTTSKPQPLVTTATSSSPVGGRATGR